MHFIDRRSNPQGKSLENRQRFLRRAKALVRQAVKQSARSRDVQDIVKGGEVVLPIEGMHEPRLRRGLTGVRNHILPGNKTFVEGDILPRSGQAGGNGREAGTGEGVDAFRFVLSAEEFIDLFLDDLELPDLARKKLAGIEQDTPRRAGFQVSGSPANLSITRTMRLAMARRLALHRPGSKGIRDLEVELEACSDDIRRAELIADLEALRTKQRRIPFVDPIDVRYRRFEECPKPIAQAVMFCLMDVSGSMSEHMKDLAKRFYMLLYIFLQRRYRHVDVVFIRHTDQAEEVDEETFFRSQVTGGTLVSTALEAMQQIVRERYPPGDWNIYAAQASDGDNAYSDSQATERLIVSEILPVCQYFAYLEVAEASMGPMSDSVLWSLYQRLQLGGLALAMRKVNDRKDIYPVFRDLFQRQPAAEAALR